MRHRIPGPVCFALVGVVLTIPGSARQQPFPDRHVIDGGADEPTSVVTGDFDRDGDIDVAATIRKDGLVSWWENPGWTEHTIASGFAEAHHLVAADLDQDGWLDLVGGKRGAGSDDLVWWKNPGGGGGAWAAHVIDGSLLDGVLALTVGDVDDDGRPDVVAAGFKGGVSDGIVTWFRNNGGGTFLTGHDVDLAFPVAHSVAVGDVDGSGTPDIVAASYQTDTVAWYRLSGPVGSGSWVRTVIATGLDGPVHVLLLDADADHDLDVAVCAYNDDEVVWYANGGDGGSWTRHGLGLVDGPYDLDLVDLDRDGDADLVGAGRVDGTIRWWERTAPGTYTQRLAASGIVGARSTAVADLDGDGDLDIATAADTTDQVSWIESGVTLRTAKLAMDSLPCNLVGVDVTDVESLDIDDDGSLDLLATIGAAVPGADDLVIGLSRPGGWSCSRFDILPGGARSLTLSPGTCRFALVGDDDRLAYGACSYSRSLGARAGADLVSDTAFVGAADSVLANLDGDRDVDLAAVSTTDGRVAWWRYDGYPAGYSYHWIANRPGAASLRAGDLDRDGDLDLAVVGTAGDVVWIENDAGTGLSWTVRPLGLLDGAVAIRTGDLNRDGWLDLVAAGETGDEIRWWQNLGPGGSSLLWTPRTVTTPDGPRALELADLDRDGTLDVVYSRPTAGVLAWCRNYDGAGTGWVCSVIPGTWSGVDQIAVADVLTDGYPDLLLPSPVIGTLAALRNRGGQFSIGAVDLSPASLDPSTQVPLLALLPAHLGRIGDLPLELRALNLHFDDGLTPLTTPQLGAIFANLAVYYDANGNFVFDGGDWSLLIDSTLTVDGAGNLQLDLPSNAFNPPIGGNDVELFFLVATTTATPHAAGLDGVRVRHRLAGADQLRYDDHPAMAARPEYFSDRSTGLMAIGGPIFADGFESGNVGAWSSSAP